MTTLTWAARGVAAVSGAVLAGALLAPAAFAHTGPDPKAPAKHSSGKKTPGKKAPAKKAPAKKTPVKQAPARPGLEEPQNVQLADGRCSTSRDISSAVVDYSGSGLFETVFRSATDNDGHAFLNDSRNPGVWINLGLVPGAPRCVYDTAVSVTEESPGHLYITLLAGDGTLHQAVCTSSAAAPFTPANLAAACTPGFTELADTPV
ncbi:hypothetical protein ACGFXC_27475 [Streptomyces sp. NPDC048507]|uniref:hypothetical protein n=1 Tax=Streptomyces sp. NPDC048507 TaxID=3365560 RepID=UPI00371990F5